MDIAVVGSGIAGLSAAWLLKQNHRVTLFEAADRLGGHSNTAMIEAGGAPVAVDTGFIVYNEPTYPNLTAFLRELGVDTAATDMSFAVSKDRGRYEYAGSDLAGLLAQPLNLVRPRFWSMVGDLLKFYRTAPRDIERMGSLSLNDYLDREGYGTAFRDDHLYPMAAAIWSTPAMDVGDYPAAAFVRFCENHGLLKLSNRPVWRTVKGGSRMYVRAIEAALGNSVRLSSAIERIERQGGGVTLTDQRGGVHRFEQVVIATHADQALRMLASPSPEERRLLGAFRYARNEAVLHTDTDLMPRRKAAWAAWNYLSEGEDNARRLCVSYWMNRLQPLGAAPPLFVTLNPTRAPRAETILARESYDHPVFNLETDAAQRKLWSLQGQRNTWFCGAHFGAGFHEDGLQSGLAVAEDLGGARRPWRVAEPDGRIHRTAVTLPERLEAVA